MVLAAIGFADNISTDTAIHELAPLLVEAHPTGADESTSSYTVVEKNLSQFNQLDLQDRLLSVPGLHIDQPGGPGGRSTLYIRGGEENHALVFLDGIPLNDPTNSRGGAVDFSLVGASAVKKIAVVRGPASVRYGPEVLSGVIHLESFDEDVKDDEYTAAYGGQDYHRVQAEFLNPLGKSVSTGILAVNEADGKSSDGGKFDRSFFRGALNWDAPVKIRTMGWYSRLNARSFPDDSGGIRFAVLPDLEHRILENYGGGLEISRQLADHHFSVHADYAEFNAEIDSPGVPPGKRDPMGFPATVEERKFTRTRAQLMLERNSSTFAYSAGLDFQREYGQSKATLYFGPFALPASFDLDRNRVGAFGEVTAEISRMMVFTLGIRADRFSDEDWRSTVRGGLRGNFNPRTEWRLNAGTAFKPPSFYALANPLVGNSNLDPETSDTLETGLRHVFSGRGDFFELTLFSSRFYDGIDFDPGPPPMLVNRGKIRSQGIEWRFGWYPIKHLAMLGSLSWIDASIEPSGEALRGRPEWRGGLQIQWIPMDNLTAGISLTTVSEIKDTSVPTGNVYLPGYWKSNSSLEYSISDNFTLLFALDNVFNHGYEEAVGFRSRERRVRLGARAEF